MPVEKTHYPVDSAIQPSYNRLLLDTVRSHKVLGLTIQNNLKRDEQIFQTVTKASKRHPSGIAPKRCSAFRSFFQSISL